MRVLILTAGSTGDVVPYTGLAARLAAEGHDVAIATHQRFAPVVAASGAGFRLLRGDPGVLLGQVDDAAGDGDGEDGLAGNGPADSAPAGDGSAGNGDGETPAFETGRAAHGDRKNGDGETPAFETGRAALGRNVKVAAAVTRDFAHHIAAAVGDGGADVLLLAATVAPLAWHVAEALELPTLGAYVQPAHPTRAFAPPFITSRSLGARGNRAAGRATEAVIDRWIGSATRELRSELGLPPLTPRDLRRRLDGERWPVCYGFSPAVVPRPDDWRPGLDVVGYWWPHHLAGWRPPPELVDFLDAGPPPVFVGFGSAGRDVADRLGEVVRTALRQAGVRAIVQAGWAGLGSAGTSGRGDVLAVDGHVAHDWLLPRVAAVVHHGGAGTTAATLRAGVPSVPVPLGVDSRFWADRLDALGVSPGQVRLKRRAADRLAAALRRVASEPAYRDRAQALARRIEDEDGAGAVADRLARAEVP